MSCFVAPAYIDSILIDDSHIPRRVITLNAAWREEDDGAVFDIFCNDVGGSVILELKPFAVAEPLSKLIAAVYEGLQLPSWMPAKICLPNGRLREILRTDIQLANVFSTTSGH